MGLGRHQGIETIVFRAALLGQSKHGGAHVPAEACIEVRNEIVADAIAQEVAVFVGSVFSEADLLVGFGIAFQGFPGNLEKRADNCQGGALKAPLGNGMHASQTLAAGASEEAHDHGFHLIIGMMRQEEVVTPPATGHFGKELVACFSGGRF
jgi:hypothetical protein